MEKDKDRLFKWNGGKKFFQNFIGFIVLVLVSMTCVLLINAQKFPFHFLDFNGMRTPEFCAMIGIFYVLYRVARFLDI